MSILIGGIDPSKEIVELHYELRKTQFLLEKIINSEKFRNSFSPEDIEKADEVALKHVQRRFPDMGIQKK